MNVLKIAEQIIGGKYHCEKDFIFFTAKGAYK